MCLHHTSKNAYTASSTTGNILRVNYASHFFQWRWNIIGIREAVNCTTLSVIRKKNPLNKVFKQ